MRRFWDNFVWNWDVLLHGNPATDIFNGLKLAAGGELGIGVGEEEWGSGEREVLEGFIGRTDGLVDLIVSRFGDAATISKSDRSSAPPKESNLLVPLDDWHLGQAPRPSDGVIFSGIGAIGRPSVKHISNWVITLFKHGQNAYGIQENPVAVGRRQRKKSELVSSKADSSRSKTGRGQQPAQVAGPKQAEEKPSDFGIPAPIVGNLARVHAQGKDIPSGSNGGIVGNGKQAQPATTKAESTFGTETLMKYMTFGLYGSRSMIPSTDSPKHPSRIDESKENNGKGNDFTKVTAHRSNTANAQSISPGYFMVGLQGDLDEDNDSEDNAPERDSDWEKVLERKATNSRIMIRTLVVQRFGKEVAETANNTASTSKPAPEISYDRLRVVVYINRPFIFTFLFDLQTDSLAIPSFYRSLHHQLGPLQQPLLNSTSPSKVSERLSEASVPKSTATMRSSQPICDLVYDPYNLTVHTTIPNIPEPGAIPNTQEVRSPPWTRVEALSVHSQILNTCISTRRCPSEFERTCKTNRGWWVVWMRLPHVAASRRMNQMVYREAFLIRKASDYIEPASKASVGSWRRNAGASSGWAPGKLAEGIGIDARQYIEGLVSLNR